VKKLAVSNLVNGMYICLIYKYLKPDDVVTAHEIAKRFRQQTLRIILSFSISSMSTVNTNNHV